MILSIGEILADVITADSVTKEYLGGAPFNVAADIAYLGGAAGFIGRVGKDRPGAFLAEEAKSSGLKYLKLEEDATRKTTRAIVTLDESGERNFRFDRANTADYFIDAESIDFQGMKDVTIVHLGTLMLSEAEGVERMEVLLKNAKAAGKIVSMDMNFRSDIYPTVAAAIDVSMRFLKEADIVKVSEDELFMVTGDSTPKGLRKMGSHLISAVTMGAKGSALLFRGEELVEMPSEPVRAIDTTGAGDAFFAGLLCKIEEFGIENLTAAKLKEALIFANRAGAKATQMLGAILR